MNDDGPERTPDGRHVVIDGRRWRATDPDLPEELRSALVGELMAATLRALARRADRGPVSLSTAAQVLTSGRDGHEPPGLVHDVAADLVAGGDVVWVDEARDAVTLRS